MQNQNESSVGDGPSETAVFRLSLLLWAGIAAAVCWIAADMLLVGFVQEPERYPLLSQTLAPQLDGSVEFAVLMQAGSPERLLWGVLPATFSVVLYLAAAFGVYRLMRPGRTAKGVFAILFFGYALSPLGHAGFYFTGMAAKALLNAAPDDYPLLLDLFRRFYRILAIHWTVSVGSIAAGWLLLLVQTLRRKTLLPRAAAWCNPLPVGTVIAFSCSLFPQSTAAAALGGATFNLAQLVFFVCAAACVRRRAAKAAEGRNGNDTAAGA